MSHPLLRHADRLAPMTHAGTSASQQRLGMAASWYDPCKLQPQADVTIAYKCVAADIGYEMLQSCLKCVAPSIAA